MSRSFMTPTFRGLANASKTAHNPDVPSPAPLSIPTHCPTCGGQHPVRPPEQRSGCMPVAAMVAGRRCR